MCQRHDHRLCQNHRLPSDIIDKVMILFSTERFIGLTHVNPLTSISPSFVKLWLISWQTWLSTSKNVSPTGTRSFARIRTAENRMCRKRAAPGKQWTVIKEKVSHKTPMWRWINRAIVQIHLHHQRTRHVLTQNVTHTHTRSSSSSLQMPDLFVTVIRWSLLLGNEAWRVRWEKRTSKRWFSNDDRWNFCWF